MTRDSDSIVSKQPRGRTYYDILGIPVGASVNHVKDSYRLLTKKDQLTDAAYEVLTDPTKRTEYNARLTHEFQSPTYTQVRSIEGYQRIDSDTAATNRIAALTSLKEHGFRDCTSQVENTPSWATFVEANGSGTERYFFSEDNQYLLMIDFSPFVPAGEGWHTLGWWLYRNNGEEWEPTRDGELGDYSLPLTLHELVKHL